MLPSNSLCRYKSGSNPFTFYSQFKVEFEDLLVLCLLIIGSTYTLYTHQLMKYEYEIVILTLSNKTEKYPVGKVVSKSNKAVVCLKLYT